MRSGLVCNYESPSLSSALFSVSMSWVDKELQVCVCAWLNVELSCTHAAHQTGWMMFCIHAKSAMEHLLLSLSLKSNKSCIVCDRYWRYTLSYRDTTTTCILCTSPSILIKYQFQKWLIFARGLVQRLLSFGIAIRKCLCNSGKTHFKLNLYNIFVEIYFGNYSSPWSPFYYFLFYYFQNNKKKFSIWKSR